MWYSQAAANQSDASAMPALSFFDCKDLYEKAYAHKAKIRESVANYRDWLVEHRKLMDPQAFTKSALLGRLLRAEARAEIAKFRALLNEAEATSSRYKAQINGQVAA